MIIKNKIFIGIGILVVIIVGVIVFFLGKNNMTNEGNYDYVDMIKKGFDYYNDKTVTVVQVHKGGHFEDESEIVATNGVYSQHTGMGQPYDLNLIDDFGDMFNGIENSDFNPGFKKTGNSLTYTSYYIQHGFASDFPVNFEVTCKFGSKGQLEEIKYKYDSNTTRTFWFTEGKMEPPKSSNIERVTDNVGVVEASAPWISLNSHCKDIYCRDCAKSAISNALNYLFDTNYLSAHQTNPKSDMRGIHPTDSTYFYKKGTGLFILNPFASADQDTFTTLKNLKDYNISNTDYRKLHEPTRNTKQGDWYKDSFGWDDLRCLIKDLDDAVNEFDNVDVLSESDQSLVIIYNNGSYPPTLTMDFDSSGRLVFCEVNTGNSYEFIFSYSSDAGSGRSLDELFKLNGLDKLK